MEVATRILYGHRDHKTVDVTAIFREQYEKGRRFNSIFGDPCPGIAKHLYFLREDGSCLGVMAENTSEFKPIVDEWKEDKEAVIVRHFKLTLGAVFRNESWILKEWLDHYLGEGVEQFFLVNNNSTDDYMSILEPYIEKGWVTLFHEERPYTQVDSYNNRILPIARETADWLIICDLDEFIYARKGFRRIIDYLDTVKRYISVVAIPWKIFGSSHLIEHPRDGVVANFIMRQLYPEKEDVFCKSICRPQQIKSVWIHYHNNKVGYTMTPDNNVLRRNLYQPIDETILENSMLHINHYAVQSKEYFTKIKNPRSSAHCIQNVKDDEYFQRWDRNEVVDVELKNKKKIGK